MTNGTSQASSEASKTAVPEHTATAPETTSFFGRHWQKVLAAGIWIALVGGFLIYGVVSGKSPIDLLQETVTLLQSPIGGLIYIVIYALRPIAFFPATVITIMGGAIFGPFLGVIYTIIGSNISATVAYAFGYFLGKGVLDESASTGFIQSYADRMRQNSFITILIMRLIYLPYDLVNYLAGLLHINYRAFILATILGSIPGTLTFVLAGASIDINEVFESGFQFPTLDPWTLAASFVLFIGGLALSKYLKQREARQEMPTDQSIS
ncbi:MAG: TVP38/TMEM64 family protein [Chloroflexaceae bacterium]|nr:TVP38/TMEM64 family protein [Chloroflexaceae bacterium]